MNVYDVYFNTTYPMCISIMANSAEEAERIIKEDDGTILDKNELLNRFLSSLEYNEYYIVSNVEKVE